MQLHHSAITTEYGFLALSGSCTTEEHDVLIDELYMHSSELNCMWCTPLGSCGVTASADRGRVELGGAALPEIGVRLLRHLWRSG